MKKIINKNTILGLIVGIIVSGVTVYAVTYNADQINFTPKNTNWKKQDGTDITNVKDALDDLYKKDNISGADLIVNKAEYVSNVEIDPNYKYFILTDIYWNPSAKEYDAISVRNNIKSVENASFISTGLTGRNSSAASTSGSARSFIIIPDGSGKKINITLNEGADSLCVYGIK